ncbi:MAG: PDZ domain-containing protein, partial [Gemmatimonadota bacterium]|nr:PDZ domain-containing protein [Gemmatimonadota bacterium]
MLPYSLALIATLAAPAPPASAPITNIQYDVTFNRETASRRSLAVDMRFDVGGNGEVILSLPAWTPGAYDITNFAKWVSGFEATASGTPLDWDKVDYDTWRIRPAGHKQVKVSFQFRADSLDNAMAWSREDFAFFNGTNILFYPEGRGFDFGATLRVNTERDWLVATGMHGSVAGGFREKNFHDLVDMPFFVGRIDYDSMMVDGLNVRLATYPAGKLSGPARAEFWGQYRRLFAPQIAVFGETPFDSYTTLIVFSDTFGGGSALEHQNSHLGIYTSEGIGQDWIPSITSHEMVHAWNVKRMRPAEMMPYRYDAAQPTPWLWVSEGITDYYGDIAVLRAGITDSTGFLESVDRNIQNVEQVPPVALEDASLSTWIHPTDGTGYIYYPKGSLAGFMLDILIRDASDNRRGLDDVMREVYHGTYKKGKGFGAAEWWGAVSRAAGGKKFDAFNDRYIDGRDPFPWDSVLPLAGMRRVTDSVVVPRLGIMTSGIDSTGVLIEQVVPGGAAAEAGIQAGDRLQELGGIPVTDPTVFEQFRAKYAGQEGGDLAFK